MAFNSPFGKYEYVKVPFGLAQAPAYFQELMTGIVKDFNFTIAYLDNIIVFSKTPQEHLSHIRKVFEKLQSAKLSMKMSKCNFFSKEIQYFGYILSATGIQHLPSNVMYGSAVCECVLRLSRGKVLHIYIDVGAPQYTTLIFGFSFLWMLARIKKDTMQLYSMNVTLYCNSSIFNITIPQVIHKYTLICMASCCSLYL